MEVKVVILFVSQKNLLLCTEKSFYITLYK